MCKNKKIKKRSLSKNVLHEPPFCRSDASQSEQKSIPIPKESEAVILERHLHVDGV